MPETQSTPTFTVALQPDGSFAFSGSGNVSTFLALIPLANNYQFNPLVLPVLMGDITTLIPMVIKLVGDMVTLFSGVAPPKPIPPVPTPAVGHEVKP